MNMTDSMNLITAQISFLDSHLVLVHIPVEYYSFFVQPILRILYGEGYDEDVSKVLWTDRHGFLNLNITPVGCSLACSKALADKYLVPLATQFNNLVGKTKHQSIIDISKDEYVVIQVEGQGIDAGERVLELTGPLAMAGISIFFITTYFSDYILVPVKARHTVVTTLQQRGFVFSLEAEAYVSQLSPTLPQNQHNNSFLHERPQTASSSGSDGQRPHSSSAPMTPPAKDIPELQIRTFTKLFMNGIEPIVDPTLRLVSCAADRDADEKSARRLKEDLLQVLLATNSFSVNSHPLERLGNLAVQDPKPYEDLGCSARYLSVTLSLEPASILMEERLLPRLGGALFGSKGQDDILIPIILDLRTLGWAATGIVGGVAGRLSQGPQSLQLEEDYPGQGPVEITFLSSAKAGSVIVQATQLDRAIEALQMGMEEVKARK